jgi:dATP pyrophosphohydrolase
MKPNILKVIDVYPYKRDENAIKFLLCLRKMTKVYGGQWRMIGGKIKENELAWQAALREFDEETQMRPNLFWCVPTLNTYFDFKRNEIMQIPAFAIEVDVKSEPILNDEHSEYKWIEIDQLKSYPIWPEQERIIKLIHQLISRDQIVTDWLIE